MPNTLQDLLAATNGEPFEVKSSNLGMVEVLHRDCPLCGRNNDDQPESPYSLDVWTVRQCADCGFVYIDKGPDYSSLFEKLSWETTTKTEETRRADLRPISYKASKLTRMRMHLLPRMTMAALLQSWAQPGAVLDLGCGDGGQMINLADGYIPHGIEVSTELAQHADERFAQFGGTCYNAPALAGLKSLDENLFSAVTLRSYLEHEMHPLAVLHEIKRVLAPGGVVIIKVPNYGSINRSVMGKKWCGFRYPDHLNYFTPKSLKAMAVKLGYTAHYGLTFKLPTSDNMYAVLKKP